MANAKRDENSIAAHLGTSSSDGTALVPIYADPVTHRLYVNVSGTVTTGGFSTLGDGRQTVTNAGTRVALAGSTACTKVIVTALETNTNDVVIGGATVVASAGTRTGIPLLPTQQVTLEVSNLNLLYIDSVTNGEGVSYTYFN